eukprot:scaffold57_cov254-Pinguiococcus_pyrenoidosus.AAC.26
MSSTIPTIFPTWASLTSSSFSVTAVATASTVDTETPASSARPKFFWMASSRASSCSPSFSAAEDSWLMKSTEGRPLINESSRATNCSVMRSGAAFGCFSRSATASSGRVAVAMESNCPEVLSGTDERLVKGTRSAAAQESAEKRTQSLMSDVEKRRENAAQKKTCESAPIRSGLRAAAREMRSPALNFVYGGKSCAAGGSVFLPVQKYNAIFDICEAANRIADRLRLQTKWIPFKRAGENRLVEKQP